jgi:TonB family protein
MLICAVSLVHMVLLSFAIFQASKSIRLQEDPIILGQLLGFDADQPERKPTLSAAKKQLIAKSGSPTEIQAGLSAGISSEGHPAPLYGSTSPRQASHQPRPRYPLSSKKLREEGLLMLQFCINQAGAVDAAHIITSSGYSRLDSSALEAIKEWRFPRELQAGADGTDCYRMPVQFSLKA